MKDIGIVITTYQRADGSTPALLARALESVKNQSFQNYKLIVVGDKYEDGDEFSRICLDAEIDEDKRIYINLPHAEERERYPEGGTNLWRCGGCNARNEGVRWLQKEWDIDFICHLDHDDYWHDDHLYSIAELIDTYEKFNVPDPLVYVGTVSTYFEGILPIVSNNEYAYSFVPGPGRQIHSSVCVNHRIIDIKYRDTMHTIGVTDASDADFFRRLGELIVQNNYTAFIIPKLTCFHPTEQNLSI